MKNWKAIVGVVGVFLLGMLAGGLIVGGAVVKRMHRVARGGPVFTAQEITRHVARRLDLDVTQRAQVLKIVQETQQELRELRAQTEPAMQVVVEQAIARTRELLRPEQQAKLDELVAKHRGRWKP